MKKEKMVPYYFQNCYFRTCVLYLVLVSLLVAHVCDTVAESNYDQEKDSCKNDDPVDSCNAPVDLKGLEQDILEFFDEADKATIEVFGSTHTMGPGHVWCEQVISGDASRTLFKKSFGDFPLSGERAVVGLRSISKIIASASFLALIRMPEVQATGLSLETKVGEYFKDCGVLEDVTIRELFAMNATGLDGRLAALIIAKRAEQGIPTDHVGFPPVCDELGYSVTECVTKLVCPAYAAGNDFDEKLETLEDETCAVKNDKCAENEKKGGCASSFRYMMEFCGPFCDMGCCDHPRFKTQCMMLKFDKSLCKTSRDSTGGLLADGACKKTCGTCSHKKDVEAYGYRLKYDEDTKSIKKKLRTDCIYDNYGYTLIDGVVEKVTGKSLIHWIKDLILIPLEMTDGLQCMGLNDNPTEESRTVECYKPPVKFEDHVDSETWPKSNMVGLDTESWISNALYGSARDFMNFNRMLMNNGTWNGVQVLTQEDVDTIFSKVNTFSNRGNCIGTSAYGLGVGYCEKAKMRIPEMQDYIKKYNKLPIVNSTLCEASDYWTWAGSYGSRILYLRDKGVTCTIMTNQASYEGPDGNRISSRCHIFGHPFAKLLIKHVRL